MQVNAFNFLRFEMGKEQKYSEKKSKFQRAGSKCGKAGVEFSSELIYYVLRFSQHAL